MQKQVTKKIDTLLVYNKTHLLHTNTRKHPEIPDRITEIIDQLRPWLPLQTHVAIADGILQDISQKISQEYIIKLHGEHYHQFIEGMWDQSFKKSEMYINTDTYYMKDTYTAALAAVRTTLIAVNAVIKQKFRYAFAIVRPPGHHSGMKSQPHGFSFFNNSAIAAQYALEVGKLKKIAILDWDAHHGEGTQNIFYKRKDVLYLSLHRYDKGKFFPHISQSSSQNIGTEQGLGYNVNICWNLPQKQPPFQRDETVGDQQYSTAFRKIVMPIFHQYEPDLIVVSCGFDSGDGDTIGNLKISRLGYMLMCKQLKGLNKPLLLALEGGYNFNVLRWASQSVTNVLSGNIGSEDEKQLQALESVETCNKIGEQGIQECLGHINKYWNLQ